MKNSPRATLIPSGRLFSEFLLFSPCQSTPLRWPGLVAAEKPRSGRRRRLTGTEGTKGRNHSVSGRPGLPEEVRPPQRSKAKTWGLEPVSLAGTQTSKLYLLRWLPGLRLGTLTPVLGTLCYKLGS